MFFFDTLSSYVKSKIFLEQKRKNTANKIESEYYHEKVVPYQDDNIPQAFSE